MTGSLGVKMIGEVRCIWGKMRARTIAKPIMDVAQTTRQSLAPGMPSLARRSWWQVIWFMLLLLLSAALYILLISVAPVMDSVLITPFLYVWMLCFVPYFVACLFVLLTKPASGPWRWVELGIILAGGLALRIVVLSLPPNLSHDSWRYLWDARVTLHGYSPYVNAPWDKVFVPLRDFIYENSRFRNVPTIYPPGAQAVYLLSYLLAPSNLFFLKGVFVVFDMVTCCALALLLVRKGLDPRRMIIYAWCPLPIVEFAIQGHMDAVPLMFMVLAVLCATFTWRGSRALTGFLIGMATLTKIYPVFLLIVIMRRRDWPLLFTCLATIIVGYIPFLVLGHGQVLGYFSTYAGEQGGNAGVVQLVVYTITHSYGFPLATTITIERIVDVMVVLGVSFVVLALRHLKVGSEATVLLMIGTILAISSHVFPWYTTVLLPWIALLIGPVWTRQGLSGKGLAVLMAWYFSAASLAGYFFNDTLDWHVYYWSVYAVVMAGLGVALTVGMRRYVEGLHRLKIEGDSNDTKKYR
jgi:Glycosyltransferase family 87